MPLTPTQEAQLIAAIPLLTTLQARDAANRAAADMTTLKNQAAQIISQLAAVLSQADALAAAQPAFAAEIASAKAAFVNAVKATVTA